VNIKNTRKSAEEFEVNNVIGSQLKRFRQSHGFTQATFAELLGVSTQQFQKYENGKNRLRIDTAELISRQFNIELGNFVEYLTDHTELSAAAKKEIQDVDLLRLVQSYEKIKDPLVRKQITELIQTLASK
jgi:transcriptional regulator with XRE-family HTH domain